MRRAENVKEKKRTWEKVVELMREQFPSTPPNVTHLKTKWTSLKNIYQKVFDATNPKKKYTTGTGRPPKGDTKYHDLMHEILGQDQASAPAAVFEGGVLRTKRADSTKDITEDCPEASAPAPSTRTPAAKPKRARAKAKVMSKLAFFAS
ncbi:hypothetical protein CYMTET_37902 [Cymbomonas tetramitiformis]|uniref:MADF domain-containing protein n=1 Tax=Cymbomonas tetramitiformis TaxID=36881 RepID=A0AAE0CD09_9CHLO|nr:hypothetical protein CYMTET_37902 [Cymbomonas tetramitiformis]